MIVLERRDANAISNYARERGYDLRIEVTNNIVDGDYLSLHLDDRNSNIVSHKTFDADALRGVICLPAYLMTIVKDMIHAIEERKCSTGNTKTYPSIERVTFNDPATIIFWSDGTKTVVKAQNNEPYDPEKGLAVAISKKFLGNKGNFNNIFKKFLPKDEEVANG